MSSVQQAISEYQLVLLCWHFAHCKKMKLIFTFPIETIRKILWSESRSIFVFELTYHKEEVKHILYSYSRISYRIHGEILKYFLKFIHISCIENMLHIFRWNFIYYPYSFSCTFLLQPCLKYNTFSTKFRKKQTLFLNSINPTLCSGSTVVYLS